MKHRISDYCSDETAGNISYRIDRKRAKHKNTADPVSFFFTGSAVSQPHDQFCLNSAAFVLPVFYGNITADGGYEKGPVAAVTI